MYNIDQFISVLKECQKDESLNEYAKRAGVDAGYLSRIINKKKKNPPSPKVLEKIARASNGSVKYKDLMLMCGYMDIVDFFFEDAVHQENNKMPLIYNIHREGDIFVADCAYGKEIIYNYELQQDCDYFAYKAIDDSMAPLLNVGDIAIIEKHITKKFKNGKIYMVYMNDTIMIRKLIENDDKIELQPINPYCPSQKTTKDKFIVIGKVIKAEIQSAFK